ncbi:MAG: ADP-ribosylation factor-like protein [Candidatus Hodarchaeota archaeon]
MSSKKQNLSKKIVILGLAESGKSTIINSVIEGIKPQRGERYSATINYQRKKKILCGVELSIFDLGGQTRFLDRFTGDLAEFIFSDVDVFIFVIEPLQVADFSRAKYYLELALEKLTQYSSEASIYFFLHKIDLVPDRYIDKISNTVKSYLIADLSDNIQFYETSVFSESMFRTIGDIFSKMIRLSDNVISILEDFIQRNQTCIDQIQLLTHEGVELVLVKNENRIFEISREEAKNLFDAAVEQLILSDDQEKKMITIEAKEFISISYFLENGLTIFCLLSKNGISGEISPSIYNKIIALSNQIMFHTQ